MNNPLLEAGALPAFHKIEPQHIKPAMAQIIAENRQAIDLLLDKKEPRWHNLVDPLALLEDRLSKSWSPVRHMNSVKSSESLREAYDQCLPLLSEYATELGHNRRLYEAFKHIAEADDYAELDGVQQKAILDALKHFRLSGVGLEGKARQSYQDLQKDLSALQSSFANNLL
ncbi:MAG: oligopeptidase A, partial [Gammaproteobacteria bacterium]|nr:oligopeptidase A [Gammaproteobacteria bacterium]